MQEYVRNWQKGWIVIVALGLLLWGGPAIGQEKKEPAKKPESSPEAINLYADAANAQNKMAFDVAADQWQEFLTKFPKDPLAPKAQHYLGVCQLQLKRFDKAADAFAAVIKNHPGFDLLEDAYLNWAWSLYSQANPAEPKSYATPLAAFNSLLEKYPKGKFADQGAYFQGECHYNQGQKKEAIAAYQRVVQNFEKSSLRTDALYALGVTREELSQFAEAGQSYDLFLKEFPEHALANEVRMRKAETLLQTSKIAEAEQQFAAAAKLPNFASADHALSRQAFCLTKLDRFVEAAALYAKLIETYPQSAYVADAQFSAGRCLYRAEKFAEATPWLQKVADSSSAEAAEAAHWLCRIQLKNKQPAAALALADKALPKASQSAFLVPLQMDRADALYELPEQRAAANEAYAKIAADHPKHELAPQALYNVAFAGLEARKFDATLGQAATFLSAYPQHRLAPDVLYVQAECQLQLGKYPEAERTYRDLLAKHATHTDAETWRVRLGLSSFLQKKYAETVTAVGALLPMLKGPDAIAEANYLIGASEFYLDHFDRAAAALQASLKANEKWRQADETWLLLSRAQRRLNQAAEAKISVETVLKNFPQSKQLDQAHYRLGEYATAAEDFAGAVTHYETVLAKFPDSPFAPYALYGQGWSRLKLKQFAPAVESFTTLLDKSPQHALAAETRFARALARRQLNDFQNAAADLAEFLKTNPTGAQKSAALYERGLAEVGLKNLPAAVVTFSSILKDDPKYADSDKVLYELAWAHKSQNQAAEAVAQFGKLAAEFPQSPLAAEANFHVGEDRYERKQYDDATKAYQAARQLAPQGEIGEKAAYKLGWTYFQLKQYQLSLEQFAAQVSGFPTGALAADGQFMKGECLFRQEKYAEALTEFQAARKSDKLAESMRTLVLLHAGQAASQLKQWPVATELLSELAQKFPDSPYLAEAHYELGFAKHNSGQSDQALKDYEVAATKSRDAVGARARFMMGELHFEKKSYDDAIRQFQRVLFGYGGDNAPPDVKNWQARSAFEAARCYEVQASSATDAAKKKTAIGEARKLYQQLVERHAQHELVADAKKRLAMLPQ